MELAGRQGSSLAKLKLGDCYYYGECGVNVNYATSFQYYYSITTSEIGPESIEAKFNLYNLFIIVVLCMNMV